ncbi:MAG TPA: acyl-CoA dehydrogenase family protein [Steroidobacteraceae bacterium]|nr:acyl-CoA dehydrogenase family protein [Steroidobacteraceae bacterium]
MIAEMNGGAARDGAPGGAAQFELSAEQRTVLDAADRYAREQLYPLAARMDAEEWWPAEAFARLGADGYLGITVPQSYGGAGLDLVSAGLVAEAFSRWNHALGLSWLAHDNLCVHNLYRHGSEAQRRRHLPPLCSGAHIGALALTEPGAGSDALGSMRTSARRDGDHYVLNGTKMFITNGPVADVLLTYAKTDSGLGTHGVSAFIVEREHSAGLAVAQKLTKMGFRGSQTGELVFNDCRVPVGNLLGEENGGVGILMTGLDLERASIASICLGVAERALQLSVEHAKARKQFGRPIADFEMIQAKLAEMYVCIETMRTLIYRVLAAADALGVEGGGRGAIHAQSAASVLYAAESMARVLSEALQIHGGGGYIWESEINRLYRAIKLLEIGAGTSEIRKLIIARELLEAAGGNDAAV